MNKTKFYDAMRGSELYKTVPQSAVNTLDLILDDTQGLPVEHIAIMMATAYHEVGSDLRPKRETMNYSVDGLMLTFPRARISAADAKRLGRKPGEPALSTDRQRQIANLVYGGRYGNGTGNNDGWDYRGGGLPQTTFKDNYRSIGAITGVDLVKYPERIVEPHIAVLALVEGMKRGTYTGKKLSDYKFPSDYPQSRAIINNDVAKNGGKIAGHARIFESALRAAGYSTSSNVVKPVTPTKPVSKPTTLVGWLISLFRKG